jgi:hypothetical protein
MSFGDVLSDSGNDDSRMLWRDGELWRVSDRIRVLLAVNVSHTIEERTELLRCAGTADLSPVNAPITLLPGPS